MIVLERSLLVTIPDESRWDDAILDVVIEASIAQDVEANASDPVEVIVRPPKGFTHVESGASLSGRVGPGSDVVFTLKTEPYPEDRSLLILPKAELRALRSMAARDDA
jgi:hypothetical protein